MNCGNRRSSTERAVSYTHLMKKAQEYGFKDINGNDCITATTFHNGWNYDDYLANFTKKKLSVYDLGEDGRVTMDDLEESFVDKYTFIWKLVNEGILDKECFTTNDDRANEKMCIRDR